MSDFYAPATNLLEGLRNMFPHSELLPGDEYFFAMAEADIRNGRGEAETVKSYFIRNAPFSGAYALLGGLTQGLMVINDLQLDSDGFQAALKDNGHEILAAHFAQQKRLRLEVYAPPEGSVFFPNEPIVSVRGPLPDVRIAEGILTVALNFPSLSLTKWRRLVNVGNGSSVLEFARRRAQNHLLASLYGILAGCSSTSNAELRRFFDVPIVGTMGHEWIQSHGDPKRAFTAWLQAYPAKPVGLVDTVQCMKVDFPAWLDAVYENRERIKEAGAPVWGWRNDSGDLAFLPIEQYRAFLAHPLAKDEWFRDRLTIILTNEIDEWAVTSIKRQILENDLELGREVLGRIVWAAGTKPGTSEDQPSIGGVLKLMECDGKPTIKLALDAEGRVGAKTSIPGFNGSALVLPDGGEEVRGVIIFPKHLYEVREEKLYNLHRGEMLEKLVAVNPYNTATEERFSSYRLIPQQRLVYDSVHGDGFTEVWENPTLMSVRDVISRGEHRLNWTHKRLEKPHVVPVWVTPELANLRRRMAEASQLQDDYTMF